RYETILEEYAKTLNIEALTMSEMTRQDILPSVSGYIASLAEAVASKRAVVAELPCTAETALIQKLSGLLDAAYEKVEKLDTLVSDGKAESHNALAAATYYKDVIIPAMAELRAVVDQMEVDTAADFWPYPSYGDLMFRV
ncbi:MAG: glutamine synthetase type III, partial [Acutalibacter sp.]